MFEGVEKVQGCRPALAQYGCLKVSHVVSMLQRVVVILPSHDLVSSCCTNTAMGTFVVLMDLFYRCIIMCQASFYLARFLQVGWLVLVSL